ncbi:hypothetical protein THTE_0136 [Thermogutta terrifontis]|uniref:Uncharacterized protein n=1 Tax=Thermogutta terrifontis TaxID=1331910 RepID=A0A286R9U7_9BACT|nr:hypothetical protein THTE_0136 [Thermogutta terrifontis]
MIGRGGTQPPLYWRNVFLRVHRWEGLRPAEGRLHAVLWGFPAVH